MTLFQPYSLGTNLCQGYSLEQALDIVGETGFEYAELSSIYGMCEHIDPALITPEYAEQVKNLLEQKGLRCHAVSGHVDPTIEEQCEMLLKKIEFAGRIGAKIVNTNAGSRDRMDEFYKNMKRLIEMAERWNVVIGLESHGDIVHTAQESLPIFKHFNHPLVRLNYDTGNTYFYCRGDIAIEEDIKYSEEFLAHLHLKDTIIRGESVQYVAIGDGDINFPAVFEWLKSLGREIPCGLEVPVQMQGVFGDIRPVGAPLAREVINDTVRQSVDYVNALV